MFCPKCGNNIIQGSRFCNKCGNQMPEPVYAPMPGQAVTPQPVYVYSPAPIAQKQRNGVGLLFAIISAILCFTAIIAYYAGYSLAFRLTLRSLRSILGFTFLFETVTFISGIASSFLTLKNPSFTLIPGARIFITLASKVALYIHYVNMTNASDYTRQTIRKQFVPLGIEMIILIAAFVVFQMGVINKNRTGVTLSLVSAAIFILLSLSTLVMISVPLLHNSQYASNLRMFIRASISSVVSFSRLFLYGSFILLSFGVFARNRRYSGQVF